LRQVIRNGLPLVLASFFLILLARQLEDLQFQSVFAITGQVTAWQWGLALGFTGLSFLAVGRYDAVVHRFLDTGVSARRAGRSGIVAIAISQTTGSGLITGTLSRWRMLPETSLLQAGRVTTIVAVTFLTGWLIVASIVLLLSAPAATAELPRITRWLIPLGFSAVAISVMFSLLQPRQVPVPRRLSAALQQRNKLHIPLPAFPPLKAMFSVLTLTFADTFAA